MTLQPIHTITHNGEEYVKREDIQHLTRQIAQQAAEIVITRLLANDAFRQALKLDEESLRRVIADEVEVNAVNFSSEAGSPAL